MKSTDMASFTDGRAPDEEESEEESRRNTRNTIALGMDADNFLRSDIGRYLDACAKREIAEFLSELATVEPEDSKEIRRIQMEIAVRRTWGDWMRGAINAGHAAQEIAYERGKL